uniref:ABC protein, subfamily ABCH n=1 Tax=Daphnia galeata TaxID=27404 RepID=A0A8J2WVT3_9CRUS|nr:unnamed protein product [Daphnia galeata]
MTEDVIEESADVLASPQRIDSETINSASDSGVDGVIVRNANKSYGSGKNKYKVLQDLNMTVKKGTIYGLLGASGCGKTTILSCLVALRTLNSGEIQILGHELGSAEIGIPGPQVGYMPQELALYGDFTIHETLTYFGRIYKLKTKFVKSQLKFLSELLDLPPSDRLIKTLSGGQQRRASFAVALFHEPELLILDEPTVGVDPLLRHNIWNHLVRQSVDHGRTVIVTTHYIEEAKQANTIGMMRGGRLLVEDSPGNLIRNYGLPSLEDIFLKICLKDDGKSSASQLTETSTSTRTSSNETCLAQITQPSESSTKASNQKRTPDDKCHTVKTVSKKKRQSLNFRSSLPSPRHVNVLIRKNALVMFRNVIVFLASFFLPAIQTALFNVTLGGEPTSVKMAIVNEELDLNQGRFCSNNTMIDCSYSMLSCRYLQYINDNIIQVPYDNVTDALAAGKNGEVWGVIQFGQNFTEEYEIRQLDGNSAELENIFRSRINVSIDSSNQQIDAFIHKWLVEAYRDFCHGLMKACGHEPGAGYMPVVFTDPVYGQKDTQFTESMAPGLIIAIIYSSSLIFITGVFVGERQQGLVDRNFVAGVKLVEIFIGHVGFQFVMTFCQTSTVLITMLLIFKVPCHGNVILVFFISLMQGSIGLCFGMLIASICDNINGALYLTQANFLPILLMGGICWPIEGMPSTLQVIARFLPVTYGIECLRSICSRGWGIEMPVVYMGFLVSFAWIFGLIALTLSIIRYRKYSS